MKSGLIGLIILGLATFTSRADEPLSHAARLTTDYIDTKISLDYSGFVGFSVDSLGKEHFPLVQIETSAKAWPPLKAQS